MNFFQSQDKARALSKRLVFFFILAMLGTATAIHTIVAYATFEQADSVDLVSHMLDWKLILIDYSIVGFILCVGMLVKLAELKSLGPVGIAVQLGGSLVTRGATRVWERRLYNVVEEIALASGAPVPQVFIMNDESGINACAIGKSPENAAVCVTRGALDYLSRDELQGVIAHEFSHIVNNDVSLNVRLIGMLFSLQMIMLLAFSVLRGIWSSNVVAASALSDRRRNDSSGGVFGVILAISTICLVLGVIGGIGYFFGNLLAMAVSRQREYLADASAVQFTRNPSGISGALKKIGCPRCGSKVSSSASLQAAHLFFGSVSSLTSTHPPLVKRIRAIEPTFDGKFPTKLERNNWNAIGESVKGAKDAASSAKKNPFLDVALGGMKSSFAENAQNAASEFDETPEPQVNPAVERVRNALTQKAQVRQNLNERPFGAAKTASASSVPTYSLNSGSATGSSSTVDNPVVERVRAALERNAARSRSTSTTLGFSRKELFGDEYTKYEKSSPESELPKILTCETSIVEDAPDELDSFLVDSDAACAVFFVILFDKEQASRARQASIVNEFRNGDLNGKIGEAWRLLAPLEDAARLIVARQATPLLKTLVRTEYVEFRNAVVKMCEADGRVDLFEYTILASTICSLDVFFRMREEQRVMHTSYKDVADAFVLVASHLAYDGALKPGAEQAAFRACVSRLDPDVAMRPEKECTLNALSRALNFLSAASSNLKDEMLRGFYRCVANDCRITEKEAALISAITAAFGVPAPIWRDWA